MDLTGYVTVDGAATAPVAKGSGSAAPGYLGVAVVADARGRPVAEDVRPRVAGREGGDQEG